MKKLTTQQLGQYQRDGFVVVPEVFPQTQLQRVEAEIERLQAAAEKARNPGWIMQLGLRSPLTRAFAQDERVLTLIEDIVRPGIAIYSAKLTAKLPQSDEICHWHQDNAYYNAHAPSAARMSTWIPLRDADLENGCLWVVPGSHKKGVSQHGQYGGQCPQSMGPADMAVEGAVPCPVRAGDMLLFSADLWHHSKENHTDQIRRAFIVSYQEATVPLGNGAQWKVLRAA